MHIAIFYRNFQSKGGGDYKHVGLGVNAVHTAAVLRRHDVEVTVHGIWDGYDIAKILRTSPATHALIEAPFIGAPDLDRVLLQPFPHIKFLCRAHSQISFLQVEAGAIKMIREYGELKAPNFSLASNSQSLAQLLGRVYDAHCVWLPNLYDITPNVIKRPVHVTGSGVLRVSSFGAIRLLKNHTGAAGAALEIARRLGKKLEFYINSDREEHGKGVVAAIKNMFSGLDWASVVEVPWQDWQEFRKTVAGMDLCLQPSFTETFCLVMADAASQGVPCVGSTAIDWLPQDYQTNPDDVHDIALRGTIALFERSSGLRCRASLENHVEMATKLWMMMLKKQ